MTDYKYMTQEKSRTGTKAGGRETIYNGSERHSNGRNVAGNPNGHQDHLSSPVITHTDGKIKPLHAIATDGEVVTKTETIVEYIRVPMVMAQGASSPSIITPVSTTVSPFHQHSPKADEYITNVQTEATRTYKTGPLSNLYWWFKPSSNSGIYDYGKSNDTGINTGINKYHTPTDGGMRHQHFHYQHGRNDNTPEGKLFTKSNSIDNAIDQMKSGTVTMVPSQSRLPPPIIPNIEVSPPTLDSKEVARRYGGLSTAPVEAYVPAIDSKEAAFKYRGQVL